MDWKIIHRGKRIDNGKWVIGFYFNMGDDDGKHVHHFIMPFLADLSRGTPIEKIQIEVDPETICQYTNAIAIGGKKIYENDIVGHDGTIGIVKFGKYGNGFHFGYYIQWINCPHFHNELYFWENKVNVIGNIFDNPELLDIAQYPNKNGIDWDSIIEKIEELSSLNNSRFVLSSEKEFDYRSDEDMKIIEIIKAILQQAPASFST